jgi:flagellar basal-body rod protein FlgB
VADLTIETIQAALHGLSMQQHAIANNIANAETPGFIASKVSFESQLADAIQSGDPTQAGVAVSASTDPVNAQGNNVQIDGENVALINSGLQYQLMVQAINSKFSILRTSIQGQ